MTGQGKGRIRKTSRGEIKRKLVLARSLVNHPELLILDEPTTGLDPHSRHTVSGKTGLSQICEYNSYPHNSLYGRG